MTARCDQRLEWRCRCAFEVVDLHRLTRREMRVLRYCLRNAVGFAGVAGATLILTVFVMIVMMVGRVDGEAIRG